MVSFPKKGILRIREDISMRKYRAWFRLGPLTSGTGPISYLPFFGLRTLDCSFVLIFSALFLHRRVPSVLT